MRIAHEIVEKNASESLAIVGIHIPAERPSPNGSTLWWASSPARASLLGDLDISLYRDDIEARAPDAQPVVLCRTSISSSRGEP